MYDIKVIKRTLKLLEKYGYQLQKTSYVTGIKTRTIRSWYNKQKQGRPLLITTRNKSKKWSDEEIKLVIDYYFEHGRSYNNAIKKFGYPSRTTLRSYVIKDKRYNKPIIPHKKAVFYDEESKKQIVIEKVTRETSVKSISEKYNTNRVSIYEWEKKLTGQTSNSLTELDNESDLVKKIQELKKEYAKLELENKVLKKANELLKKDVGADYSLLNNKEKAIIVSSLKNNYSIAKILRIINLSKSTYYYEYLALKKDKYKDIRILIKQLFYENYKCYGYRRMKAILKSKHSISLSEKVVRRLMKEENLIVYKPKSKRYSSYIGEISPEVENIIKRDFSASEPHKKALTDITEFSFYDGKVYLSPLIDCFTGIPITWTISKAPNSELTNSMLKKAYDIIGNTNLIIHSDRGFHYRLDSWIDLMTEYGYIRSMSKKGCSPDNSACEGFFGTLKNEFYYSRNWKHTKRDDFIIELEKYLKWFAEERIKSRFNYLTPKEYLLSL